MYLQYYINIQILLFEYRRTRPNIIYIKVIIISIVLMTIIIWLDSTIIYDSNNLTDYLFICGRIKGE